MGKYRSKWESEPANTLAEWIKSAEEAVEYWTNAEKEAKQNKELMTNRLKVLKSFEKEMEKDG